MNIDKIIESIEIHFSTLPNKSLIVALKTGVSAETQFSYTKSLLLYFKN